MPSLALPRPTRRRGPAGRRALLLLEALAALLACGRPPAGPPQGPQGPVEVGVVVVAASAVPLSRELPGRVSAFRVAEVRARVNGIVLKRHFTEGADVRAGQPLFTIDAAPYRAALASARAQLARAEASLASARLQAQRYGELVESNAVSRQDYDNAAAAQKAGEAEVAAAQAAVEVATINLGYTSVTAPVAGRIGRSAVTEGAYAQAGQATLLATIQQLDPVFVDVAQSSVELLRLRRALESGQLHRTGSQAAQVSLVLEDGSSYGATGALQFSDVTVDGSTGSVTLRALFPNPQAVLLPGMFVRARLDEAVDPQALLVPQLAVARSPTGEATAMVVGEGGKAELRALKADRAVGNSWLVTSGLRPGDQVIVSGLQKIRPGAPVKAVPAAASAEPAAAAPGTPAPPSQR
jgi:membrane fusion protein, multidrug efflux system